MIKIQTADIATVVRLSKEIPELYDPYEESVYRKRLDQVLHLILVAYENEMPVGFKVGYEREKGSFYSWMGGVLPAFRRRGIAKDLADAQERWAKANGFACITFKTRNRLKAMLTFALNNGFDITQVEERENINENRIWLKKQLK